MKTRIVCFLLTLTMLLGCLVSCGGGNDTPGGNNNNNNGNGNGGNNADYSAIKGETVVMSISANQDSEVTFPAADVYTMGPDVNSSTSNPVQKKVLARNKKVANELGVTIEYQPTDLWYDQILDDLTKLVQGAAEDAPDIYNNDMYGLTRGMMQNYLWNVIDPGEDADGETVVSHFDFTHKSWNYEFMKGCTFDQSKMYLLAGDYFLDMIRMAWVFYVNLDVLTANIGKLGYQSVDEFFDYVSDGYWDYVGMASHCADVFRDGQSGITGETEKNDATVGAAINHVSDWVLMSATGITTFYQDENGTPQILSDMDLFGRVTNRYLEFRKETGVYYEVEVLSSTTLFMNGNFLFAHSVLGEMESESMREIRFNKSLVPTPKWSESYQERYHTMVHDQTEVGAILNTTFKFEAASAVMQKLSENSADVLHEYYNNGLKFKYNDDQNTRDMIDLVHDTIDSPFGMQLAGLISANSADTWKGLLAAAKDGTISSTYESERGSYEAALKKTLEQFDKLL